MLDRQRMQMFSFSFSSLDRYLWTTHTDAVYINFACLTSRELQTFNDNFYMPIREIDVVFECINCQ